MSFPSSYNFEFLYFCVITAAQKIDRGLFLHEAELKIKKEKKCAHSPGIANLSELGEMLTYTNPEVSCSSSTNSSDENFIIHYKKKRM